MYVRNFPEAGSNTGRLNIPKNYGGVYFSKNVPKPESEETVTKLHTPEQTPDPPKSTLMSRERSRPLIEKPGEPEERGEADIEKPQTELPEADEASVNEETPPKKSGELPINPEDLLIASVITALLREGKGDLLPLELALLLIS
ncbi:MAG: hypothetical protein IKV54_03750 [Clostridia bacterium]|nr:hypothetical protein [Clostridia bacterium]